MEIIIFILAILALILLFFVSGRKGFKSLFSLALTVLVLMLLIVPLIISGHNPVIVTFVTAIPLAVLLVYTTEGFSRLAHLSIVAIIINFIIVSLLTAAAISLAHFTGIVSDASSIVGGELGLNLPNLLVAGIMLGTLGAIIELVVTQVATVIQFSEASPAADHKLIYHQAYGVGVTHLGSIINTLFLIYAGILLPLLIMFAGSAHPLYEVTHYEPLSSEIIRTLLGAIGLIIAMPTSTFLAVWWLKRKSVEEKVH